MKNIPKCLATRLHIALHVLRVDSCIPNSHAR